VEGFGVLE